MTAILFPKLVQFFRNVKYNKNRARVKIERFFRMRIASNKTTQHNTMSYLTVNTKTKQVMASRLVDMMLHPETFDNLTLQRELDPYVRNQIITNGPYKATNTCANSCECCEVFDTGTMGRGIRATRTISNGTAIGCYSGVLRANTDKHNGDWKYNYAYGLDCYYIDASGSGTDTSGADMSGAYTCNCAEAMPCTSGAEAMPCTSGAEAMPCNMAMLNHSVQNENVNVEYELHEMPDGTVECHIVFIAKRDIVRAEELFIDYGEDYWKYAKQQGTVEYQQEQKVRIKSVLRIDEDSEDVCDTHPSPYFIDNSQKLITDYMIKM